MPHACDLCGTEARLQVPPNAGGFLWTDCPDRGAYSITTSASSHLERVPLTAPGRLNLISFTYENRNPGGTPAVFWKLRHQSVALPQTPPNIRSVEDYLEAPIRHSDKPDRLLLRLAEKLTVGHPFDDMRLSLAEARALKMSGWHELARWMTVLVDRGLVEDVMVRAWVEKLEEPGEMPGVKLTPSGWAHAEELAGTLGSRSCFIAMSFGLPNRAEVQSAVVAACEENGWEAKTVDEQEFQGSIADRIIANIKRARFVVADFTEHRHGVYFEAGFAEGRGIPVVYTVHQDDVGRLHFDTRHLNHIVWKTSAELRDRLSARIAAIIDR